MLDKPIGYYCPLCQEPYFKLYPFGEDTQHMLPMCAKCAVEQLSIPPGLEECSECGAETVEKRSMIWVDAGIKKVQVLDERLYCPECETEFNTEEQAAMNDYRIKVAVYLAQK